MSCKHNGTTYTEDWPDGGAIEICDNCGMSRHLWEQGYSNWIMVADIAEVRRSVQHNIDRIITADQVAYVLGYLLTPTGVMLIQKVSPPAWAGKANAIGGKIRPGELPKDAMVREFREETGILTRNTQWQLLAVVGGAPHPLNKHRTWDMHVFWIVESLFPSSYEYHTTEGTASIHHKLPENLDSTAHWLYMFLQDHLHKGLRTMLQQQKRETMHNAD